MTDLSVSRPLSGPLVWVGLFLILVPMVNVAPALWPVALAEPQWRFGAIGNVLTATFFPVLGVACLFGAALIREDARTVGWLAGAAFGAAALLVLLLLVFLVDGFSLAGSGEADAPRAFWAALVRAVGIAGLSAATLGGITFGAKRAASGFRSGSSPDGGLVVRP